MVTVKACNSASLLRIETILCRPGNFFILVIQELSLVILSDREKNILVKQAVRDQDMPYQCFEL